MDLLLFRRQTTHTRTTAYMTRSRFRNGLFLLRTAISLVSILHVVPLHNFSAPRHPALSTGYWLQMTFP